MLDVCSLLGTQKLNTMAYHPKCGNMIEQFNYTLKSILLKRVTWIGAQRDMDLSAILWAY